MNDATRKHVGNPEDLALATLRAVTNATDEPLPWDLVERLYRLQKRHQFDSDRAASVKEMQQVLEQYVDSIVAGEAK